MKGANCGESGSPWVPQTSRGATKRTVRPVQLGFGRETADVTPLCRQAISGRKRRARRAPQEHSRSESENFPCATRLFWTCTCVVG